MNQSKFIQNFSFPAYDQILQSLKIFLMILVGAILLALGFSVFQLPFNLAAGGISGIAIIVNHFTGWPAGLVYFIINIPLLILGFKHLGRWHFLVKTLICVSIFSTAIEVFSVYLPQILHQFPITEDMLLSSIYGGIITGIGTGIIYRAGSTAAGTSVISRIVQRKTGIPLSQVYLFVDGAIILVCVFTFGWEIALHALLLLFIGGLASDFALEGPSTVRTASIITDHPQELVTALMQDLHRGVSIWDITGGYTGQKRSLVFCTVNRAQVGELKQVVAEIAPEAFMVIGEAHQALGSGFIRMRRGKRNKIKEQTIISADDWTAPIPVDGKLPDCK